MKKSFSLLELILVILLLSILYTLFIPKTKIDNLEELKKNITLQIKHLRNKALIDSKYINSDNKWQKQNWTIKFFRCNRSVGGLYYIIYSDTNKTGHPNQIESLKDPLTNKYIFSSKTCVENEKNSKYTLLTKNFNIQNVNLSCNSTDSLGQLSFSYNGNIYSKLTNNINKQEDYELKEPCILEFIDEKNQKIEIKIENKTGYVN